MNEKIQKGKEKGIEWIINSTHADYVIISIYRDNNLCEEYIYHYMHKPIFGIDVEDRYQVENKLDELINKWGD